MGLTAQTLQAGQHFIHRRANHQHGEQAGDRAQRTPSIEQHPLEDHEQNANDAQRSHGNPGEVDHPRHRLPTLGAVDDAGGIHVPIDRRGPTSNGLAVAATARESLCGS